MGERVGRYRFQEHVVAVKQDDGICTLTYVTGNDMLLRRQHLDRKLRESKTSHSLLVVLDGPLDASRVRR